jgi:hypothetical protein
MRLNRKGSFFYDYTQVLCKFGKFNRSKLISFGWRIKTFPGDVIIPGRLIALFSGSWMKSPLYYVYAIACAVDTWKTRSIDARRHLDHKRNNLENPKTAKPVYVCFPNDATPNYRFLVAQKHFFLLLLFFVHTLLKDRAAWNSVNVFGIWLQAPKQLAARRRSMMAEPARDSLKETWGGFEILHARSG